MLVGEETELDRTVIDALGDPLVHLVRNAVDHGLEPPEERVAAGKPATGTVTLSARQAGSSVVIDVRDDGRGVDPAALRAQGRRARSDRRRATPDASTRRRRRARSSRPASPPPSRRATSPAAASAWTRCGRRSRELGGDVRSRLRARRRVARRDPPPAHAGHRARAARPQRRPHVRDPARPGRAHRAPRRPRRCGPAARMPRAPARRPRAPARSDAAASLAGAGAPTATYAVSAAAGPDDTIALPVDGLVGQRELVARPLPPEVVENAALSGAAVLSDGDIALIVDCDGVGTR